MYVCDDAHDEILEIIFTREELNYGKLILEGEIEISDDESECNEYLFCVISMYVINN